MLQVAPDAPPAPQKRHGDEYHGDEEDEDEYAYNGEDAEYYNVKVGVPGGEWGGRGKVCTRGRRALRH